MNELIVPTVNLNGNDGTQLVGMALDIKRDIDKLLNTMAEGADLVHGRNFQTSNIEWAHVKAREAFDERRIALAEMAKEFEALALAIHEQVRNRK